MEAVAPIVDSTKTDVSQVVGSEQILELPINGRRVDSFALISPAVVPDGTFGLVSFRGIAGGNNFLTDGNDTTEQYYNENAGRTRITSQISQDAVQEFQVVSNNYSAEFGHATGGVVNTVTRSGRNDFHGTGYWFFRNQDFNAKDTFATINPLETRHQFGVSVGGKIIKDKLFYFFNYDGTRRDFPLDRQHHGGRKSAVQFRRQVHRHLRCARHCRAMQRRHAVPGSPVPDPAPHRQAGPGLRQTRLASHRAQFLQRQPEPAALGFAQRAADRRACSITATASAIT